MTGIWPCLGWRSMGMRGSAASCGTKGLLGAAWARSDREASSVWCSASARYHAAASSITTSLHTLVRVASRASFASSLVDRPSHALSTISYKGSEHRQLAHQCKQSKHPHSRTGRFADNAAPRAKCSNEPRDATKSAIQLSIPVRASSHPSERGGVRAGQARVRVPWHDLPAHDRARPAAWCGCVWAGLR